MPRASKEDHALGLPRFRGRVLILIVTGLLLAASAVSLEVASSRRLRSEVNRVRQQVGVAREDALKVEADRLAERSFKEATAKSLDGERQASNGSLRAAAETLREAAAQYEESGRIAKVVGAERAKADEARAVMLSAKKGASRETQEYEEAVAYEGEGHTKYGELAFQAAAQKFDMAARLFVRVPAPPQPPPPASTVVPTKPAATDATAEIRETLRLYARVFEAKDLALLQRVRPDIKPEELARFRAVFDGTRSYKVNLKVDAIKVNGNEAVAKGRREDVIVTANGDEIRKPGEFQFRLKLAGNRWTIDAVR